MPSDAERTALYRPPSIHVIHTSSDWEERRISASPLAIFNGWLGKCNIKAIHPPLQSGFFYTAPPLNHRLSLSIHLLTLTSFYVLGTEEGSGKNTNPSF
jgi:hypothetical protein